MKQKLLGGEAGFSSVKTTEPPPPPPYRYIPESSEASPTAAALAAPLGPSTASSAAPWCGPSRHTAPGHAIGHQANPLGLRFLDCTLAASSHDVGQLGGQFLVQSFWRVDRILMDIQVNAIKQLYWVNDSELGEILLESKSSHVLLHLHQVGHEFLLEIWAPAH